MRGPAKLQRAKPAPTSALGSVLRQAGLLARTCRWGQEGMHALDAKVSAGGGLCFLVQGAAPRGAAQADATPCAQPCHPGICPPGNPAAPAAAQQARGSPMAACRRTCPGASTHRSAGRQPRKGSGVGWQQASRAKAAGRSQSRSSVYRSHHRHLSKGGAHLVSINHVQQPSWEPYLYSRKSQKASKPSPTLSPSNM